MNVAGKILYLTLGLILGMFGGYFLSLQQVEILISHDKLQREIDQIESKKGVECVYVEGVLKCVVYTLPDVTS